MSHFTYLMRCFIQAFLLIPKSTGWRNVRLIGARNFPYHLHIPCCIRSTMYENNKRNSLLHTLHFFSSTSKYSYLWLGMPLTYGNYIQMFLLANITDNLLQCMLGKRRPKPQSILGYRLHAMHHGSNGWS